MYKIIGADGKEYGPVTLEQLRDWITQGRVNAQTLVQTEGATEWTILRDWPEFADMATPVAVTLRAPAATHDYHLEIGSCIGRGWELLKANMGLLIGGTTLVMLAQIAIAIIPFIGSIGNLILGGALTGGMYWLYILTIRGEATGVGDAFAGFNRGFGQLMLGNIVRGLLAGLAIIPGAIVLIFGVIAYGHNMKTGSTAAVPLLVIGGALCVIALPFVIYLTVCWFFTLPLIIDKRLDFWPAMQLSRARVRKQWWNVFGLLLVSGLVALLGVIACGIGMLFTVPIGIGATMQAYEDIFGDIPPTR